MKELRFHPQFASVICTTAEDSFNVFRPNLDPVEEKEDDEADGLVTLPGNPVMVNPGMTSTEEMSEEVKMEKD